MIRIEYKDGKCSVTDADTGAPIAGVRKVEFRADARGVPEAFLHVLPGQMIAVIEPRYVTSCPLCERPLADRELELVKACNWELDRARRAEEKRKHAERMQAALEQRLDALDESTEDMLWVLKGLQEISEEVFEMVEAGQVMDGDMRARWDNWIRKARRKKELYSPEERGGENPAQDCSPAIPGEPPLGAHSRFEDPLDVGGSPEICDPEGESAHAAPWVGTADSIHLEEAN